MSELSPERPQAPDQQLYGGHTGQSFNRPVLGLPDGMSVQEAHVLARQQNTGVNETVTDHEAVVNLDLITAVPSFELPPVSDVLPVTPILTGPRQTGSYQLPNGNTVSSRISDGMKETYTSGGRSSGPIYKNAAEFYASKGMSMGEAITSPSAPRKSRFARMLGRLSSSK